MENYLPNKVADTSNFRHAWNKLLDYLRRMQLQTSSDILVTQGTHGTSLMVSDRIKKKIAGGTDVTWKPFNESASFSKGTIVWVDPNGSYSISFYSTGSTPPLSAGAFIVENDVPASGSRPYGNLYYPFYPTWDDSDKIIVSNFTYNQIFYRPLNPLTPQTFCDATGTTYSGFGSFFVTGSVYDFDLPYP